MLAPVFSALGTLSSKILMNTATNLSLKEVIAGASSGWGLCSTGTGVDHPFVKGEKTEYTIENAAGPVAPAIISKRKD